MIHQLNIQVSRRGLNSIGQQIIDQISPLPYAGLCTIFIQHTSASLLIQENYDSSAQVDLENWLDRLVPENDPLYTHTLEGSDDMPAHIKSMLTATSLCIPISAGQLALGAWQGIYLWEHRHHCGSRKIVIHVLKDAP